DRQWRHPVQRQSNGNQSRHRSFQRHHRSHPPTRRTHERSAARHDHQHPHSQPAMNLAEALDVLPEITTPTRSKRVFKMDSRLVGREHIEEGALMFLAHVPGSTNIFRLTPEQWKLAHLFDGQRSYAEIAELFLAETAIPLGEEDVRNFAEMMQDVDFWYQSPQERNIALMQKLRDRRKKQKKTKSGDMARIVVAQWDSDLLVDTAHRHLQFIYTPWFTALTLALFAFMSYIFFTRWS